VFLPLPSQASFFDGAGRLLPAELDHADAGGALWWVLSAPDDGLVAYYGAGGVPQPAHEPAVWGEDIVLLLHFEIDRGSVDEREDAVFDEPLPYTPVAGPLGTGIRLGAADGTCIPLGSSLRERVQGSVDVAVIGVVGGGAAGQNLLSWSVASPGPASLSRFAVGIGPSGMPKVLVRTDDATAVVADTGEVPGIDVPFIGNVDVSIGEFAVASIRDGGGNTRSVDLDPPQFLAAAPSQEAHFGCDDGSTSASATFEGTITELRLRIGDAVDGRDLALEHAGLLPGVWTQDGLDDGRP
jgi:hypothetical protein